jgi:hypothetical protein
MGKSGKIVRIMGKVVSCFVFAAQRLIIKYDSSYTAYASFSGFGNALLYCIKNLCTQDKPSIVHKHFVLRA